VQIPPDNRAAGKIPADRRAAAATGQPEPVLTFADLYVKESEKLGDPVAPMPAPGEASGTAKPEGFLISTGTVGEPWVAFTPKDRFGLALSGGGIRSATFNLGLLQSLDQLGVLPHVDYLATVSGGGYVGGFWSAWLQRRGQPPGAATTRFPKADDSGTGESAEVRHLREFSRFLLPSFRVFSTEFWGIVMTVLGGLLPSLASALAVLVLLWFAWVGLMSGLLGVTSPAEHAGIVLALLAGYLAGTEAVSRRSKPGRPKNEPNHWDDGGYALGALMACAVILAGSFWLRVMVHDIWPEARKAKPEMGFGPALVVAVATLALLTLRCLIARFMKSPEGVALLAGIERAMTRVLMLAALMLALAGLWWLANLVKTAAHGIGITETGAATSTGLFLWVRKWLSEPPKDTRGGKVLDTSLGWLKRASPKILATLSWLLLFTLVGTGVEWWLETQGSALEYKFWRLPVGSVALVGLMILLFDLERMGMHELYRSRICRCYLGASNLKARVDGKPSEWEQVESNRSTRERPNDDLTLSQLASIARPVHLVCTAANDIAGDPVGTLYRGAKSAVLSVHGISLGDQTAQLDDLRLSSALTASAAAFNSQMGRISMDLGPAVTFLMSAFNLRLGLWVPHPGNRGRKWMQLPGYFFFRELLGLSSAEGQYLLLSDGNHFENFGLYELVRRHCRYIIVADCGADPEVAFDDLANVLRRLREDFGVEVELDVSPLNPGANGLAAQHAVVGTIHYNGLGGMDKGTLVYIKPAITGEEPPDVLQYRTRNPAFPQESTANQFYDEPQWESYRRLGAHSGRITFAFLDQPEATALDSVDHIFRSARSYWHPMPENLNTRFVEMSARSAELEANLTSEGPAILRDEFFTEAAELAARTALPTVTAGTPPAGQAPPPNHGEPAPAHPEEIKVLGFLIRIIQIMEDVWVTGDFEHYWSHPLNEGWMNYFHRWASTPSFRRWWPVLAPMYSIGLRSFVQDRFDVGTVAATPQYDPAPKAARFVFQPLPSRAGGQETSPAWGDFLRSHPEVKTLPPGQRIFGCALQLLNRDGTLETVLLWVGFVLVVESPAAGPDTAVWRDEDFFVPQRLHGSKIVSNLLDGLIAYYETGPGRSARTLRVTFGEAPPGMSGTTLAHRKSQGLAPADRYDRVRKIEFYKSRGFQYRVPEDACGVIALQRDFKRQPRPVGTPATTASSDFGI